MHEKHEMILEKTYSSGAEEWNCPTCGRRMLINWNPKFKRTVLEAGNPEATHSGFKSDMRREEGMASAINKNSFSEETGTPIDKARLALWERWVEESNFEDLWGSDNQ